MRCLCDSAAELDGKERLDFVFEVLCELRVSWSSGLHGVVTFMGPEDVWRSGEMLHRLSA